MRDRRSTSDKFILTDGGTMYDLNVSILISSVCFLGSCASCITSARRWPRCQHTLRSTVPPPTFLREAIRSTKCASKRGLWEIIMALDPQAQARFSEGVSLPYLCKPRFQHLHHTTRLHWPPRRSHSCKFWSCLSNAVVKEVASRGQKTRKAVTAVSNNPNLWMR